MEKRISGHTGLLALIGSPVGHSGSPAMYNYSFEKLGLDYAYVAFDIKEDKVKDAIAAMKTFNMRGCNVTMPDKVEAAKYMDELSPAARIIGAINTIVNDNGKLTGHITDGEGFVHNLKDHGIDIKGKKITVAGGGGAATAIQVQCALDGAREITIFNKNDARPYYGPFSSIRCDFRCHRYLRALQRMGRSRCQRSSLRLWKHPVAGCKKSGRRGRYPGRF